MDGRDGGDGGDSSLNGRDGSRSDGNHSGNGGSLQNGGGSVSYQGECQHTFVVFLVIRLVVNVFLNVNSARLKLYKLIY